MILTPSQTDQGPTLESTTIIRLVVSYFAVILQLGWFGRMIVHYHSKNSGIYRMAVKDVDNSNIRLIESMASIAYVNFDLHIAPGGRVTAISCEGEVTADISTQTPNSIFLAMDLIEKDQTNAELLRDFGNDLFHWLFPPNVHSHLLQTEANARTKNMKVRLRLRVEEKNIARLPLEFIYRSTGNYFMATNPNIVLSRYLNVPLPPKHVDSNGEQLHILAIISDPTDQTRLDPIVWERLLQESLKKLLDNGSISLNTVKNATRKEIRDALLNKKPDIIQFIGHGIYKDDIGYLALVNEYGSTWLVDDSTFANLFMGFDDKLRFICLATCESAKTNNPQGFLGIAPKLVERGTPAVIAMQYKVLIATAKLFLEDFYESLASRKPIDWSTQYARNAISIQFGLHNREFATPVLYMHTPDGKVF